MTARIESAACIGGGVIGSGWAARFVLNGIDAAVYDPDPETGRKTNEVLDTAERAFDRLFGDTRPAPGRLRIATSITDAVDGAEFIQESVPERLDLKSAVLAEIDAAAARPTPSSRRPPPDSCRATCSATWPIPGGCWSGTRSILSTCSPSSRS